MAKTLALVAGIVFLLVAILGFMDTGLVGMNGLFVTNGLHNVVHLIFGVVLVFVALAAPAKAAGALKISGIIYLILAVLGFLTVHGTGMLLGVEMNTADHVLHLVLGVVLILAGMSRNRGGGTMAASM